MELTPDIAGRSAGTRFTDPWFDADHDGDISANPPHAMDTLPPSAITTAPSRPPPRSVPPAPDTTFALAWPPSAVATTSPLSMADAARRQGAADTLLSASWFRDASDAAEWRAVAEERRAVVTGARPPAKRIPGWILATVMAALMLLVMAGAAFLVLTLTALVLLGAG